jgi:hypothetical protein
MILTPQLQLYYGDTLLF